MLKNILIIFLLISTFVSCSQESEEEVGERPFINDPRQPGVGIGDGGAVRGVFNVKACPNLLDSSCPASSLEEFNKVTLSWRVPALYENEDYVIVIYKTQPSIEGQEAIEINQQPKDGAFERVRLKDLEFIDTEISQNERYNYWIFLVLEGEEKENSTKGFWSTSQHIPVFTPFEEYTNNIPESEDFWKTVKWSNMTGFPTGDPPIIRFNTFSPGEPSSEIPKGRIESAYNGSVFFASDTENNRILVYQNSQLISCEEFVGDDLLYFGCRLGAEGAPPTAYNILGQPEQGVNLSCQEHNLQCQSYSDQENCNMQRNGINSFCKWESGSCKVQGNKCLTKPTDLLFNNGKLYVADTGNDRVVVYENVLYSPVANNINQVLIGCDNKLPNQAIDTNPIRCQADRFFGKQSFDDFNSYSLENGEGASILNSPSGLAINDNSLYIADTGNHRIVKLDNLDDPSSYVCNSSTWLTPLCRWRGLLGQANYSEKKTFSELFIADSSILSGTFNNELQSQPDLLKRYCANPNKIKFKTLADGNNYMFISCNEDFQANVGIGSQVALKGRIIRYNNNPIGEDFICNDATFESGNCDADEVYAQESFDRVVVLSGSAGGAGNYDSLAYTINFIADFDFIEDSLMAVDSTRNNIYVWKDLINKPSDGFPYSYKAEDPEGRFLGGSQSLPNLKRIQGISFDDFNRIYVTDGLDGKIYQLNIQNIPLQ